MGALDFPHLRAFVVRDIERNEDYLSSSWYPLICQIFQSGQVHGISSGGDKLNCFYNSINTLVSNQVCCFASVHLEIHTLFSLSLFHLASKSSRTHNSHVVFYL
jgi:hypothetical protein